MTEKQKRLIEQMNKFCSEKFDISPQRTNEEARDYINKYLDEYKLLAAK